MNTWLIDLKLAVDSGYYRTEEAVGRQIPFPWQNKTCKDCPFWSSSVCQVYEEYRGPSTDTCSYFDEWNHDAARAAIQERQWQGLRRWWEWFNDRGANR